jgi:malonate transporter
LILAIESLAPVFLLIVLGYALRRKRFLSEGFWEGADRLTYFVLFPALIIHTLAVVDLANLSISGMALALTIPVLLIAITLSLARPYFQSRGHDGPAYTSLFQGAIRPNTFVGLAAAAALFGEAGLTLAAVAVVVLTPMVNLLSASTLARHASNEHEGAKAQILLIATNPLILASLAGIGLNFCGIGLPGVAAPLFESLGRAALTLGLFSVGAGLYPIASRSDEGSPLPALAVSGIAKLVLLPVLTAAFLHLFEVQGMTAAVAILFAALPTSATAYVMSRQLGGDHSLMARIITVETMAATCTLPTALVLLT